MGLPATTLRGSFAIQFRVIGALIMREVITRYGRHNVGFLWLFLEPMLFTLGVTSLWLLFKPTHGSTLPVAAFAVTGYSSVLLWRNCSNRAVKSLEVNLSLLYHRNVKVFDLLAARVILEIAGATTSFVVLTIFFAAMDWIYLPVDVLTVVIGWVLLAWFAFSLAFIVGALSERSELLERTWHIITYLLFPLSGAAFMVDWFPKSIQELLLWIPMVHCTEMIRHGYFGNAIRTYYDPNFVMVVDSFMLLVGLALAREAARRVEPE